MIRLVPMTVKEYKTWLKNPKRFEASTKSFHKTGFKRTLNVLRGRAKPSSHRKWKQFKGRWQANANDGLTKKECIAIHNWGYKLISHKKGRRS